MMLTRTRREGTMVGIIIALLIMLIVTWLYIQSDKASRSQPPQGETVRGPNQRPVLTLPDNVVQNHIDISQLSIEVSGIKLNMVEGTITLITHIKLGDKYYYTEFVLPAEEEQADATD